MTTVEISVDSLESALAAEQGGAQRVELCSGLREGGLTPSLGMLRAVRRHVTIDLYILIRPRSGDFFYSDGEFHIMEEDIRIAAQEGADGVVLGVLTTDGNVDVERSKALIQRARPMQVTFHRAFDMARDLQGALEDVVSCGADRILTSGGAPTAVQGQQQLRELVRAGGGRVTLLVGGGVRPGNLRELAEATGAQEFHSSMRSTRQSPMRFRAPQMSLGDPGSDEYVLSCVRAEDVRQLVAAGQVLQP